MSAFVGLIALPFPSYADQPLPLTEAWEAYRHAVATLPPDEIVVAAKTLREAARSTEALHAPALSLVMIRDAEALRGRGEAGSAIQIAQVASSLSPGLVTPHAWLAQTWLVGPDPNVLASLKEWGAAVNVSLTDFWSALYRIDRMIVAVLLSLLSAATLAVGWYLIRTIPLLGHLLVEWSRHQVFRPTAWLVATGVLLLPLAAVQWGWWLVLAPGAAAWWFLSARERLALTLLALFGVVAAVLLPYAVPILTADQSAELRLLVDVTEGRNISRSLDDAVTVESPQGADALGVALGRSGRMDDAAILFEEALVRWPGDPRLLTGYGNVLFHRHEYDRAVQHYEHALQAVPDSIPVLYNLSQAYRAGLRFEEGEARFQEAKAIDAGVLDRYVERSRRGEAFLVVDYPATYRELFAQAVEPRPLAPALGEAVTALSTRVSPISTIAVLALFAGCWVLGKWFPNQPASPCTACGTAVCRRCQRYFLDVKLCLSCWKTHAKTAKFTNQTTLPQVLRRWEVKRRVAAVLSFAPGLGHLCLGRPFWGLAIAIAGWGLIWIGLLPEGSWNTTEVRLLPLPWYATWGPIAIAFALLLIMGARHLLRLDWSRSESPLPADRR